MKPLKITLEVALLATPYDPGSRINNAHTIYPCDLILNYSTVEKSNASNRHRR